MMERKVCVDHSFHRLINGFSIRIDMFLLFAILPGRFPSASLMSTSHGYRSGSYKIQCESELFIYVLYQILTSDDLPGLGESTVFLGAGFFDSKLLALAPRDIS